MREPPLPNFFIAGTGKAGTTSLYHYLRQHPQIYMSPVKEPCYFASEIRAGNLSPSYRRYLRRQSRRPSERLGDGKPVRRAGWLFAEWEDYLRLFQEVQTETAIGEASVAYLWSETAAGNIASRIPGAKIVMILRDPSERAFSQYLHQLAVGLTCDTFDEHIRKCMRNRDRQMGPYYPLLEIGLYYEQVKRYLQRFPRNNVRIYWYEEAWRQPGCLLADVFQFLDVDSAFCPDISRKSLERRAPRFAFMNYTLKRFAITHRLNGLIPTRLRPPIHNILLRPRRSLMMDRKERQYLIAHYREDILNLASLVNRDLSAWLQ